MSEFYSIALKKNATIPEFTVKFWKLLLLLVFGILLINPKTREIIVQSMSDAFLAVTIFVAATLILMLWIEKIFRFDLGKVMYNNLHWQPLIAAMLGVLPGCGGAIIIVTHFTRGHVSFGALVSVLIGTMGDAAFLLIARDPGAAMAVFLVSFITAVISGLIVDRLHGRNFMMQKSNHVFSSQCARYDDNKNSFRSDFFMQNILNIIWVMVLVFGFIIGILLSFQMEVDLFWGALSVYEPVKIFGFFGAGLCLVMWAFSKHSNSHFQSKSLENIDSKVPFSIITQTIKDTNFITTWVIVAFLLFELTVAFFAINLESWFSGWALIMPLMTVLVGFIPGCGPQIIVTYLYIDNVIPMSAQISNSIANDGDALFPALLLAPKAALLATIYSAIPAIIVGYSWFFIIEN